jgi:hypothetical protein
MASLLISESSIQPPESRFQYQGPQVADRFQKILLRAASSIPERTMIQDRTIRTLPAGTCRVFAC